MGLDNYASASFNLATELRESLTEREVIGIHNALKGKELIIWLRWRHENKRHVSEFVEATPKQRLSKKFEKHRLFLTMASIQHCLEAHALLSLVSEPWLSSGGSYRFMAAQAGLEFSKLNEIENPYWPFTQIETPFIDD